MIGLSAVVGVMFSGASADAAPAKLKCGQTVTTSVKLGNDLLNCPVDGIVVRASNITIDLNGHRITGRPNFDPKVCSCGVNDEAGFDNVTLRSGRIEGFRNGAYFEHAKAVTVRNLMTSGQRNIPNEHIDGNGVLLRDAPSSRVVGSTATDAFRGIAIGYGESSNVLVENVHVAEIEHAGVALIGVTDSTVRSATIDTVRDYGVEVNNSSRILVEGNRIRRAEGDGIVVVGEVGEASLPAVGNRIERNVVRGDTAEGSGIELIEVDTGVVRETTVAHNTVLRLPAFGILVDAANSSDGMGTPPFEFLVGVGPAHNLIEDNLVTDSAPDGIHLDAPENAVTGNRANRNAEWGIDAIEGTIDGGGNTAHKNGQPAQCRGVVCNGDETASAFQRTARPAVHRFPAVGGDRPLRR